MNYQSRKLNQSHILTSRKRVSISFNSLISLIQSMLRPLLHSDFSFSITTRDSVKFALWKISLEWHVIQKTEKKNYLIPQNGILRQTWLLFLVLGIEFEPVIRWTIRTELEQAFTHVTHPHLHTKGIQVKHAFALILVNNLGNVQTIKWRLFLSYCNPKWSSGYIWIHTGFKRA